MNRLDDFNREMAEAGFQIDPITDGQIHRFPTWGDSTGETSGAYWHNGTVGWFQDHRTMEKPKVVKGKLSKADQEALNGSFTGANSRVSLKALEAGIRRIWTAGTEPDGHPYLQKKGISAPSEVKQHEGCLIIPVLGANGELNGLQRIDADGRKKFLAGTRKKSSMFGIKGNGTHIICEGFSTGVSLHMATNASIVVAFDAGNLSYVARAVSKKKNPKNIIIAGDNDAWKLKMGQPNIGADMAQKAAQEIGARVMVPEFKNPDGKKTTDFNDLHRVEGLDAVKFQFESALAQTEPKKTNRHVESKPTDWNDLHVIEGLDTVKAQLNTIIENKEDPKPDEWDLARELFPRTPFPWEVLPVEIAESLQQLARSHATSPLSLPGAAIAIFWSVIGGTINVSPKKSWHEPLIFWFTDIRPSGAGKTPAAQALCDILYKSQGGADAERKRQLEEEQEKRPKDRQEVPRSRSYFISNLTLEGVMSDSQGHGGTVCVMSELSTFITSQNQYKKKGSDREAWLILHDGKPVRIVRAKESFTISGARISLFGGIQPRVWQTCFSGEKGLFLEDGTVYRFLPTFESNTFYELTAESWNDKNREIWEQTLSLAIEWADQRILDEDWTAKSLCLAEDAQSYFFNWRNDLHAKETELPDQLKGFLPKITSYALRLAGALYCMDRFAAGSFPGAILSKEDVEKGVKAATFYLGHIIDAMQTLCSKDQVIIPVEVTEQVKQLAKTLKNLKPEIDNGRLPVGQICEQFNRGLPPEQQIKKPKVMGTLLRQCGLTIPTKKFRIKDKSGLSCLIWDEKLNNFLKKVYQHCQHSQQASVGGAPQVLTKEIDCQHCQHSVSDNDSYVDNVDEENRLSTSANPCQSKRVDNVDNVDKSPKEDKKFTMEF